MTYRVVGHKLYVGKRCRTSGKRKFKTSIDALLEHANNPRPMRAYMCPDCGYFHAATKRT